MFCVKVRGNVRGEMNGIDTYGNVSIEGNVIGGWCAVALNGKADVQIVGNVTATGDGILMECRKAIVEGNVRSQYGNCVNVLDVLPVPIDIKGNVEENAWQSAISIIPNAEDQVIVRGKIEARGKQSAVDLYGVAFDYAPAETLCNLPQLWLKKLQLKAEIILLRPFIIWSVEEWLEDTKALAEAAAKATWYIVDINQPTNRQIEVKGTSVKEGLIVAHEGDRLTITGAPKKGCRLTGIDAGSKEFVTENEDGTYTVAVEAASSMM